jgi:hypothetical protein
MLRYVTVLDRPERSAPAERGDLDTAETPYVDPTAMGADTFGVSNNAMWADQGIHCGKNPAARRLHRSPRLNPITYSLG